MSYQSYLEQAKECLVAGHVSEMRIWVLRAEPLADSEVQKQEVYSLALRCCLLTGQYEQGEILCRSMEQRWSRFPLFIALREALFAAAGWGPPPADSGQADVFGLIEALVFNSPLSPEIEMKTIGDWSRLLPSHPFWLKELAEKPFPEETLARIGGRVLPANVEAALAELWHLSCDRGEYPRRKLLEEIASEPGFGFLPAYLDLLAALHQENLAEALAASDRLFAAEGTWLWLRTLDLLRHFGTPENIERTPLRLRIARRMLSRDGPDTFLQEYRPLMSSFTHTVSRCLSAISTPSAEEKFGAGVPALNKAVLDAETLLALSDISPTAPWSASAGGCLLVKRLLATCRRQDLPASPAFPDLQALHHFVKSAEAVAPDAAALWLALPSVWQLEEAYLPLLLGVLPAALEGTAFACTAILQKQGLSAAVIWNSLPSSAQAAVFAAKPEPFKLAAMAAAPHEVLCSRWAGLSSAALKIGGQKLNKEERTTLDALFSRLAGCLDQPQSSLPSSETLSAEALSEVARQAYAVSSESEATFLCSLGQQLGNTQDWEAGVQVLEMAGEAGEALRGEVTARRWLTTGQKEAYRPEWWQRNSSASWSEMAFAWDSLLEMRPVGLAETNVLRANCDDFVSALDALSTWLLGCYSSDTLSPFVETTLFDDLPQKWKFLSKRSWRLLASTADVLPPIAGVTPVPERPLLALLHLARHGIDSQALQVVLSCLQTWETLPPVTLGLLEMATSPKASSAKLQADLGVWAHPEILTRLRGSLPPQQGVRLDALAMSLPLALASPEAKAILRLNQAKSTEKKIRLALQKVQAGDLLLAGVWDQMGQFLTGPYFCRWSLPQWEMVRKWRRLLITQEDALQVKSLAALPEQALQVFSSLLLGASRPLIIDGSNVLRDKKIKQHSDETLDRLEDLWSAVSAHGFYPIVTYVDRNEFAKQEEEHGLAAKRHLNQLIEDGLIEDGANSAEGGKVADEYILHCVEQEEWQESVVIVTNDDYAKPRIKASDIYWPQTFPWLTRDSFDKMQAKFHYGAENGKFLLRLPDGADIPF